MILEINIISPMFWGFLLRLAKKIRRGLIVLRK